MRGSDKIVNYKSMYLFIIVMRKNFRPAISVAVTPPFPAAVQAPAFLNQNLQGTAVFFNFHNEFAFTSGRFVTASTC